MSPGSAVRDLERTNHTIASWLTDRLEVSSVAVSDLTIPKAGFSNETILGTATWIDTHGTPRSREFVLRIEPTQHQLFTEPDAIRQAQVMQTLHGHVPVPTVWLTGTDPGILGAPFFLMDRVHGRVPPDVPSWHARGWATRLSTEERTTLHDNALGTLVRLHGATAVDTGFLLRAGTGTALDRYVHHLREWYEWCAPVRIHGTDVVEAAMQHVITHQPDDATASVVWGDARVGNIMFADDLSVAALLDWEGATLGPPEIDVAWWVMFDEFLCEAQGVARLDGIGDRAATFARYEQLSGRRLHNIGYYEVLTGLVLALINSRLADLLVRNGVVDAAFGAEIVTRITDMTARHLNDV